MIYINHSIVRIVFLLIVTTGLVSLGSGHVSAQAYCGSATTQMIVGCGPYPNCEPITQPLSYDCYEYKADTCQGYVNPNYCVSDPVKEECRPTTQSWVAIECGSGGGGGGGCPDGTVAQCTDDCKRISGCPLGARRENCGVANDGEQKVICHQCNCVASSSPTPTFTPSPTPNPYSRRHDTSTGSADRFF